MCQSWRSRVVVQTRVWVSNKGRCFVNIHLHKKKNARLVWKTTKMLHSINQQWFPGFLMGNLLIRYFKDVTLHHTTNRWHIWWDSGRSFGRRSSMERDPVTRPARHIEAWVCRAIHWTVGPSGGGLYQPHQDFRGQEGSRRNICCRRLSEGEQEIQLRGGWTRLDQSEDGRSKTNAR